MHDHVQCPEQFALYHSDWELDILTLNECIRPGQLHSIVHLFSDESLVHAMMFFILSLLSPSEFSETVYFCIVSSVTCPK